MKKLILFMMTSLDGYMEGPGHDLSWHNVDEEFNIFAVKQLQETDTILFGRKTYQLMENYWPSEDGRTDDPLVAKLMNETPKVVISQSLGSIVETAVWKHIRLISSNITEEIQKLKQQEGKAIIVLGSNNLCVTLLKEKLLDEIRIMINPIVIGKGTPLFSGLEDRQTVQLMDTRTFKNGNILLNYKVNK